MPVETDGSLSLLFVHVEMMSMSCTGVFALSFSLKQWMSLGAMDGLVRSLGTH